MMDLFQKAVKNNYLWDSGKGLLNISDIYMLQEDVGDSKRKRGIIDLVSIAVMLTDGLATTNDKMASIFGVKSDKDTELSDKLAIIKMIVDDKRFDKSNAVNSAKTKQQKQWALEIRQDAKNAELKESIAKMTDSEYDAYIATLES